MLLLDLVLAFSRPAGREPHLPLVWGLAQGFRGSLGRDLDQVLFSVVFFALCLSTSANLLPSTGILPTSSTRTSNKFSQDARGFLRLRGGGEVEYLQNYDDFEAVNVDDNAETAEFCNVSSLPTFQFFLQGERVDEVVGANIEEVTEKVLKFAKTAA
eukprot:749883-Hanusia_phi.AAC.6